MNKPPVFKCQKTGKCCSHIRGMVSESEKKFLQEYAYGKMPLIQLVPIEQISFPLWDWEARRFKKWEKEVKINAKIKPSRAIFDLQSNTTIIVTYYMDADSCPFLKDNLCSIYDKKRAYVCRLFPFNKGPFLKVDEENITEGMFGSCPAVGEIIKQLPTDKKEMVQYLYDAFPDGSFLNVVQHDIVTEWVNKLIIDLMRKKQIHPAMNYPYKFLLKRIENTEHVDLTEFLVKHNLKTKEEMEHILHRFDNNIDAKEKVEAYLQSP